MKLMEGGVCAAKGFTANGIHCGIRKNHSKKDLALIFSAVPASAAAVYTTNLVKGAPLTVTKNHIANGIAQAVICNSGNANTCNANGIEIAEAMSLLVAKELNMAADDVVVASTGVIGQPLSIDPIAAGMPELAAGLSMDGGQAAADHYDHRYRYERSGSGIPAGRQDLPYRRHCQGQRHDPSQHGYHAGVPDHRLCH